MAFSLKYICILLISSSYSTYAQYPETDLYATTSTSWTNNPSSCPAYIFPDGSMFRSILFKPMEYPSLGFGFYCNGNCTSFILSIIVHSPAHEKQSADVIWSSNRNHPVTENATLTFAFAPEGDLILKDADGRSIWSTGPTGRLVASLNLTRMGNLVLYDAENQIVWQSYDHPTDTLVYGQNLVEGQSLIASVSRVNWIEGAYSFYVTSDQLIAHAASNPPVDYYNLHLFGDTITTKGPYYVRLGNGSIVFYDAQDNFTSVFSFPTTQYIQYMKLGWDGHLRIYQWASSSSLNNMISKEVADLLSESDCNYPLVCGGYYSICSHGACSCPGVSAGFDYFRPVLDVEGKTVGCLETTPLSCKFQKYHRFLDVNVATYLDLSEGISGIDIQGCKQACMNNCSCKVSFFKYIPNEVEGYCYLRSDVFWLLGVGRDPEYNTMASIKVQLSPNVSDTPKNSPPQPHDAPTWIKVHGAKVWHLVLVSSPAFLSLLTFAYTWFRVKSKVLGKHESYKDLLPGIPTRFTYEELKTATGGFRRKLGQGGFGSVYEGALTDGTKVAVKCLDGLGHARKSFLAEVEILGKIHHVSLVRLIGFCTHKSRRLLVYEYLCNGSLDKWILYKTDATLNWNTRKKIIHDIAKGLAYLHEECTDKILHLDIKPQNILLDDRFNCKLSDFGLSKLIGKDKSRVPASMRGTPGYLAPEWLTSMITDKVDVYSFGIVVLEILCGRRNVDFTQPEEDMHLLSLLENKTEKHLSGLIDRHCEDMQLHKDEAMEMMKVALLCVQSDFSTRPTMSLVLKVLDGATDIEPSLDLNLLASVPISMIKGGNEGEPVSSIVLSPSFLSGPR